ncbi:hypothetical protein GR702_02140 [Novosphingobium sp. FGD1]|uniref:Uncharacterized protein n=1 Tax=Novosphingobium silvae TaxID=2692619 RepID=A0A7X4GE42_9SPHN|nr:hypothetical protein [Novosphingobium silvae]MYL96574.1 hypothetical protein [Novosphingobium silvae]
MSRGRAFALLPAGAYCIVRAVLDLRGRRHARGLAGLVAGAVILSAQVPTTTPILSPAATGQAQR